MPEANAGMMRRVRHIHLVGIGGAGMSGIAEVLHTLGYEVSGSDLRESGTTRHLQSLGIRIVAGHEARHVNGSDVIVVSSAVQDDNPEVQAARSKHIPVIPRAEMLAELMRFRQGIAIAGTHGKTTTTSLIASLLAEGGLDPTYVIGGRLTSSGTHAKLGSGRYLVAEADESDASFLHLQPVMAVVTNIDSDHLGTYGGDYESLQNVFLEFLHHLPFYGLAVLCMDDSGVRRIADRVTRPVITYAIDADAELRAHDIRSSVMQTHFRISRRGKLWLDLTVNLPGRHNVLNATAAAAVASECGVEPGKIRSALEGFQGIGRRCELLGELVIEGKRVTLIDDYGHHPSELAAVRQAIQAGWPGRRIVTVFQPHRYTRTRDLFTEFCTVLGGFDALVLLDVYAAGELPIAGADSRALCSRIHLAGGKPEYAGDRQALHGLLPRMLREDDILLVLGAGDIGSLGHELQAQYRK